MVLHIALQSRRTQLPWLHQRTPHTLLCHMHAQITGSRAHARARACYAEGVCAAQRARSTHTPSCLHMQADCWLPIAPQPHTSGCDPSLAPQPPTTAHTRWLPAGGGAVTLRAGCSRGELTSALENSMIGTTSPSWSRGFLLTLRSWCQDRKCEPLHGRTAVRASRGPNRWFTQFHSA
jgi:hypothetical protein